MWQVPHSTFISYNFTKKLHQRKKYNFVGVVFFAKKQVLGAVHAAPSDVGSNQEMVSWVKKGNIFVAAADSGLIGVIAPTDEEFIVVNADDDRVPPSDQILARVKARRKNQRPGLSCHQRSAVAGPFSFLGARFMSNNSKNGEKIPALIVFGRIHGSNLNQAAVFLKKDAEAAKKAALDAGLSSLDVLTEEHRRAAAVLPPPAVLKPTLHRRRGAHGHFPADLVRGQLPPAWTIL
jgi:hypothetical protein